MTIRWLIACAAATLSVNAQWTLYTPMATSKDYVVGAKLPPSGVFKRSADGVWTQVGYNHPFAFALDFDPSDPSHLYLAAGNGLLRVNRQRVAWTILTSGDITELRDVVVDPADSRTIYIAHTHGIRVSRDSGTSWSEIAGARKRRYTESIRVDRRDSAVLLAGTEDGLLRSADRGGSWKAVGAAGLSIMRIEQSPTDPCLWLATTQGGGLFRSQDCGLTFENSGRIGVDRNLYDIAFDTKSPGRIAIAGWGFGVAISDDSGKTWKFRNAGLPNIDVWSVGFDPARAGRLYASVHEEAVFRSEDSGVTWVRDGLEGSIVYQMRFVREPSTR